MEKTDIENNIHKFINSKEISLENINDLFFKKFLLLFYLYKHLFKSRCTDKFGEKARNNVEAINKRFNYLFKENTFERMLYNQMVIILSQLLVDGKNRSTIVGLKKLFSDYEKEISNYLTNNEIEKISKNFKLFSEQDNFIQRVKNNRNTIVHQEIKNEELIGGIVEISEKKDRLNEILTILSPNYERFDTMLSEKLYYDYENLFHILHIYQNIDKQTIYNIKKNQS